MAFPLSWLVDGVRTQDLIYICAEKYHSTKLVLGEAGGVEVGVEDELEGG